MWSRQRPVRAGRLFLVVLARSGLIAGPVGAAERGQAAPLRPSADLTRRPGGGADVALTIENLGAEPLTIADIHRALGAVRRGGREGIGIVFPAPASATVRPGGSQTCLVGCGDVVEPGEEPPDPSGVRLILGVEVFLQGSDRPAVRHFSFPGCPEDGAPDQRIAPLDDSVGASGGTGVDCDTAGGYRPGIRDR